MAVYTEIGDDELRAFIALYDIGEVLSCKGIAEGVENSNYLLGTERGERIVGGHFALSGDHAGILLGMLPPSAGLLGTDEARQNDPCFPPNRTARRLRGEAIAV